VIEKEQDKKMSNFSSAAGPGPNHSIEGTNNGGSVLRSLPRLVPPLFAPHVKR